MLIKIQGKVFHRLMRPAVYLDHWALMKFSEIPVLRNRFIDGLRTNGGSLCISALSVAEACRSSDPRHAYQIDRFLREIGDQIYCADILSIFDYTSLYSGFLTAPKADENLALKILSPQEFCMPGAFGHAWMHRAHIADVSNSVNLKVSERFTSFRGTDEYRKKAKNAQLDRKQPWLHIVLGELMRPAVLNSLEPITQSDASDLQHAAIGLMHCDLVLLDGKWADRASSLRHRLGDRGAYLAWCFSGRGDGLEMFLRALETYPK